MNKLTRIKSGKFSLDDSYTTDQLTKLFEENKFEDALISVDEVFDIYPKITVNERQKNFLINGVRVRFKGLKEGQTYRVYDESGEFLSLSECIEERLTLVKAFWN
jgi:tRNA pseudouridine55 synthase